MAACLLTQGGQLTPHTHTHTHTPDFAYTSPRPHSSHFKYLFVCNSLHPAISLPKHTNSCRTVRLQRQHSPRETETARSLVRGEQGWMARRPVFGGEAPVPAELSQWFGQNCNQLSRHRRPSPSAPPLSTPLCKSQVHYSTTHNTQAYPMAFLHFIS